MEKQKMLVVCAHVGDFIWRSGGSIAKYAREGHEVTVIALTYGIRGESNGYWKRGGSSADECREIRPDFILTHDKEPDPYNMDHNLASDALRTAYTIASGAGAVCNGLPVAPRQTPMFGFEPHMTEISSFTPGIYIDITDVFEQKKQAMACCTTQANMSAHYIRKAEIRASECANRGGVSGCRYAEAFSTWGAVCMHGHFVW